ncbi:SRCN1 inhibitor, partial [Psilopogon haemacephalus]|nr:SRCN1 inhibitor [Psilopogon haemacephalus]
VAPETDFSKGLDLEMPPSPPVNLHHLAGVAETLGMPSFGHSPPQTQAHPSKSNNPARAPEMVPAKTQTAPETPSKKSADKAVSVEAAERDWEEKRAALTQYSAKDINRLLEETQAELMKAIPDLEFAAKHKQTTGSSSSASTPEHKPSKPQHGPKAGGKGDPNGRRGSDELTVPRYRTEKPSKSPPPPPPRRSFPSSHGLTTTRSGEVIVTSKKEPGFMKKAESEELETQKPQVKLRRTVSEVVRPASTPPIIASAIKDEDDEDRIIAELEVSAGGAARCPQLSRDAACPALPCPALPCPASIWGAGLGDISHPLPLALAAPGGRAFSLPQIVLTQWGSEPSSPEAEAELWLQPGCSEHAAAAAAAGGQLPPEGARKSPAPPGSPPKPSPTPPASAPQPPKSPARGCTQAAAETWRSPPAASKVSALAEPARRRPTVGAGGDSALEEGSHQTSPLGCSAARRREATAAGAAGLKLLSAGATLQHPQGGHHPGGARQGTGPGDSAGLCHRGQKEDISPSSACPAPSPGASPGRAAAPRRAERLQLQLTACPSPAAAAPGRTEDVRAGGKATGRVCKGSLGPSVSPRSKEIYEGTYQRLDSLEETIRELEITISEISNHPAVELVFTQELPAQGGAREGVRGLKLGSCEHGTALDLSQSRDDAPQSPAAGKTKPPLLPKPQLQSGGVSIPAMKVVNPASRLKQSQQQGSPDKSKHIKQRMEYMRIQGQQQVVHL